MQSERCIKIYFILVERIQAGHRKVKSVKLWNNSILRSKPMYITYVLLQVASSTDRKMISFRVRYSFLLTFLSINLSILNAGSLISIVFNNLSVTMCQLMFLLCTAGGVWFSEWHFHTVIIYAG